MMRPNLISLCALFAITATPGVIHASGEINFCVDIPTTVSAATYQPYQTVNGYAPAAVWSYTVNAAGPGSGLTPGVHVDGLSQLYTGVYYFSVDAPATISAVLYHPADVITYNGSTYGKLWDHQTQLALGEAANLTAIAYGGGSYHIALDAPLTVNKTGGGTIAYDPRDLLQVDAVGAATYTLSFDGVAAGIPAGARIAGAEYLGAGNWLLNFDAPVTLGATTYLPGDIVQRNGAAWSLYYRDTAVFPNPPPNAMTDFALPLAPGEANNLLLNKSGGNLAMTWGNASCSFSTTTRDYEVYEGTLGTWYSHNTAKACTTGGVASTTITPGAGNTYYLVVPTNGAFEGNYGTGAGGPIPVSSAACRASQAASTCP
jgi:hypothetical protein